jgi:hypothetical protein
MTSGLVSCQRTVYLVVCSTQPGLLGVDLDCDHPALRLELECKAGCPFPRDIPAPSACRLDPVVQLTLAACAT